MRRALSFLLCVPLRLPRDAAYYTAYRISDEQRNLRRRSGNAREIQGLLIVRHRSFDAGCDLSWIADTWKAISRQGE